MTRHRFDAKARVHGVVEAVGAHLAHSEVCSLVGAGRRPVGCECVRQALQLLPDLHCNHPLPLLEWMWYRGRDLNPHGFGHSVLSGARLPFRHPGKGLVPPAGFEPATPCLKGRSATELRHGGTSFQEQIITKSYHII